jgi:hypothetical protein
LSEIVANQDGLITDYLSKGGDDGGVKARLQHERAAMSEPCCDVDHDDTEDDDPSEKEMGMPIR